jgi:hypothetical protein
LKRCKFVDESGIHLALTRLYGRAPRGERAVGSPPINYGENITLIGALGSQGLDALLTIAGATDGEVFRAYTERVLCPRLAAGDIVIMDNLAAHKVSGIREAIEARGAVDLLAAVLAGPVADRALLVKDQDGVAGRRSTNVPGIESSNHTQ